jgi:hypothetical protein
MIKPQVFEEKMFVSYKSMKGQIMHVGEKYLTFTPFNSKALLVIYKESWKTVTLL